MPQAENTKAPWSDSETVCM